MKSTAFSGMPVITCTQSPKIRRDIIILLIQMRRQLRRADTTAGRKAEQTRAPPQAAAQIKADADWTV
ncbi:hypothetical protein UUU_26680 (plasmid) [Klebsiella pneumoniae subsp. pneumoniae DSM 30104 = JCM 1662 = NBRC 14940]|nr:hypothetical protein UUU_26680 [Klebsiella pneumoniae subsp. pneumoniae DSM 30104 = JCM 1662 = NBRC 14940]